MNGGLINKKHLEERIRQAVGMSEDELTDEELSIAEQVLDILEAEPPAALNTGHWIVEENEHYGIHTSECSLCHAVFQFVSGFRFCPACGARMEGGNR